MAGRLVHSSCGSVAGRFGTSGFAARVDCGRNVKQENAGAGGSVRRKTYVQPTLNLAAGAKTATLARLQVAPSLNGFSHSKIGCPVSEKSRLLGDRF